MIKVLLLTRPIAPPWDEASKNFAYYLATNTPDIEFYILTNGLIDGLPKNVKQLPIYSSNHFNIFQKIKLLKLFFIRKQFDVVHYLFTPTKFNSFLLKKLLKGKAHTSIQTIATLREDLFSEKEIKELMHADHIATYSDYAKIKLENLGISNVTRIYPGIDVKKYSPAPKSNDALKHFNLTEKDFVITYPGEYVRLGATNDLVATIPDIIREIPNTKFVFANRIKNEADLQKKKEIVQKFDSLGLSDHIIYTDTYADMPKIYNMSDVVIFPVKNMLGKFDVPLAVIEAFACEKPVIISDIPVLKEFSNHSNSIVINHKNFKELIRTLKDIHDNYQKYSELGKNARTYSVKHFDIKNVAENYKQIYNTILNK